MGGTGLLAMSLADSCVLLPVVAQAWVWGGAWEGWAGVWGMGLMMGRTKNWSAASCRFPSGWWSSARGVAGMGLRRLKVSAMECLGVLGSGLTIGPMLEGSTGMGL